MITDTLANITGRVWLVAELDRIAGQECNELRQAYRRTRRGRTEDRREFVQSIEELQSEAFLTARAVEDGGCDIRHVLSVFNLMVLLDHAIHAPDIMKGRNKTAEEYDAGFGSKHDEHERWVQAFAVALAELERAGMKRPRMKAAELVIERLSLDVTVRQVLRVIRESPAKK